MYGGSRSHSRAGVLKRRVPTANGKTALMHTGFFIGNKAFYDHTTIRLSQAVECIDYEDRLADAHRNSEPEIVSHTIDDGLRAAVRIAEDNAPWDVCLFKEHRHDRPRATAGSPLLPRRVARLGLLVHGIEAGKLRPPLDLRDDKALHALVLGALLGD